MGTILIVTDNSDLARVINAAIPTDHGQAVACPSVTSNEFLKHFPEASLLITDLSPLVLAALSVRGENLLNCHAQLLILTTRGHQRSFARMIPPGQGKCLTYVAQESFFSELRDTIIGLMEASSKRTGSDVAAKGAERSRVETGHGSGQLPRHHIRKALSRQDQLISSIAHDLRNPLTAIREFAHLMSTGIGGSLTDQQRRYVQIIERRCHDASRMTDDLLDAARIQSGRIRPYRQAVSLPAVFDEVRESLEPTIRHRDVRLVIEAPETLPRVFADRDMLGRIVLNLVSNALKFSPAGSVVTLQSENSSVELVQTSVIDQGSGISPEDLRRIFRRFEQGPQSSINGVGLGLSIVRHLVRLHGGRVTAESTPGRGSAFHFTLPLFLPPAIVRRHLAGVAKNPGMPTSVWEFECPDPKAYGPIHRLISSMVRIRDLVLPEDASRRILLISHTANAKQLIGRLNRQIELHSPVIPVVRQLRLQDLKPWLESLAADRTRPGELSFDSTALAG